jgi:hypothetical protein
VEPGNAVVVLSKVTLAMSLTRCNDVLRPFTGGRPGLIIIRI